MKNNIARFLVGIVCLFLAACSSSTLEHVSATEFLKKAKLIEQMTSSFWVSYIGISKTRVYLEYADLLVSGNEPRTIVYWTELDKLPDEIEGALRNGTPPWTPWYEKEKKAQDNSNFKRTEDTEALP